jgi:flagellar basal-body rod protein FlgB
MLENIALFKGLSHKMGWLSTRQRVISQNITNADTPGYRPHDMKDINFKKTMGRYMGAQSLSSQPQRVFMAKTDSDHMTHKMSVGRKPGGQESRHTYETAPAENAVVLEEQMIKAQKTAMDYQMVTNLYSKHMTLLKMATSSPQ